MKKKVKYLGLILSFILIFNSSIVFADDLEESVPIEEEALENDAEEPSEEYNEIQDEENFEEVDINEFIDEPNEEIIEDVQEETFEEEIVEENIEDDFFNIDLLGMNISDAQSYIDKLLENGIETDISYDFSDFYEEDVIMESSVGNLKDLNEGDTLLLTVSLGANLEANLLTTSMLSVTGQQELTSNGDAANKGYMVDWDRIPASYEYNWDNSGNCWYWGVWIDGQCYKTPEGEYSTDVRHKMQLYCDGTYVYLHVIFSRDYWAKFNGEDYQFWLDGNMAAFQVEWPGGGTITGNLDGTSPGEYTVEVRHRDSSISYAVAEGSEGHLFVNEDNINNQLEIKIPLSEMVRQNPNINLDFLNSIEFFTPNLMYNRISCTGASTFPVIPVALVSIIAVGTFIIRRRKNVQSLQNNF